MYAVKYSQLDVLLIYCRRELIIINNSLRFHKSVMLIVCEMRSLNKLYYDTIEGEFHRRFVCYDKHQMHVWR